MLFYLLSFTVVLLSSALVVIHSARTSPEGYEDETGFHFVGARKPVKVKSSNRHVEAHLAALTQHPFTLRG